MFQRRCRNAFYSEKRIRELYENGKGVKQDYAKAAKWTRKAAEQGYLYAEKRIGEMYENGEGVPQDFDKALEWYKKTVKHGYSAMVLCLCNMVVVATIIWSKML